MLLRGKADINPHFTSAFIFGLTVCGFAGVHAYYIIRNETTIEHLADRANEIRVDFDMSGQNFEVVSVPVDDNLWERKKMENWVSVMGRNPWGWFRKSFFSSSCNMISNANTTFSPFSTRFG